MRIIHVTPSYLPAVRYGGPIRSVHGLCAGLAALGHEVEVFTTNVDGPGVSDVPLDRPVIRDGVVVRYFPTDLGRRLYRAPAMARAFHTSVRAADIVHIHAVYLWPGLMAARTAALARIPYVISPRGMLVRELIARKNGLLKRTWIQLIERRTLREAAAIHVTTPIEAAAIRDLGLDLAPFIEIPNGVESPPPPGPGDDLAWATTPPGFRVLYLGRLNWEKGLDRLLRAMPSLPDVRLVLAGNDEEGLRPRLEAEARALGVAQRIEFEGPVEGAFKWSLLRHADLLVLPSLSENFGIVVLEALGVGTPVVVTRGVGAAALVERENVGLVSGNDSGDLARCIEKLLADPEGRRTMGRIGQDVVLRNYSWLSVAGRMATAYERFTLQELSEFDA